MDYESENFPTNSTFITKADLIAFNPSDLVTFLSSLYESDLRDFQESLTEEESAIIGAAKR